MKDRLLYKTGLRLPTHKAKHLVTKTVAIAGNERKVGCGDANQKIFRWMVRYFLGFCRTAVTRSLLLVRRLFILV